MTERDRGAGRLKGAFGQIRRAGAQHGDGGGGGRSGPARTAPRRRRRQKVGKRSRPEEYAQASGFVRREVLGRLNRAMADPHVRARLEGELSEAGVEHKAGDPDYGALCELLLDEWLESVGYGA